MLKRLVLIMALAGCGAPAADSNHGVPDGGGGPAGGGSGEFPPGGVQFPWPVFDGKTPDVPVSSTGKTWYADPVHGDDGNDGTSFATARKTIGGVLPLLSAGDTLLLGGGIYREYPDWSSATSGTANAPITIGSYGHGTGAPILDGGLKPGTWTRYTDGGRTTVWVTSTAGTIISKDEPVLGIYVNSGKGEFALREVMHGQLNPYPGDPALPKQTQADVLDHTNRWYFDAGAGKLYADFGGTLGSDDPNQADISILYNSENGPGGHENLIYLDPHHDFFKFVGLTLRASSWSAAYTESSGNTFDRCDIKFNGGAAVLWSVSTSATQISTGNTMTLTRVWMNILENWPRFNNGNTGGGWPAAVDWSTQSNGLAEGNVVYMNGGEGLTLGNTDLAGQTSTGNVVRHNIIFDNFSVNLYLNNTENGRLEENFVFQHPRDETQTFDSLFEISPGYGDDFGKRITPENVALGDEPGSAYDGAAHLSGITLINNIFAGGRFGMLDYDDGTTGTHHGLRDCVIANNTFILDASPIPGEDGYGWQHTSDGDSSMNSVIQNNVFVVVHAGDHFAELAGTGAGIVDDYNLYSGPGDFIQDTNPVDFGGWKSAHPDWDQHSMTADALVQDPAEFAQPATRKLVYDWAKAAPKAGSPALGAGTTPPSNIDFTGQMRAGHDIGALAPR